MTHPAPRHPDTPSPRTYLRPFDRRRLLVLLAFLVGVAPLWAQVPAPADVFGFEPGADYKLARYDQMLDYYRRLDAASDRVRMTEIGTTVLGRPLVLLVISSEENMARLDHFRDISERLARARVDVDEARALAREGRAVVWLDGGLHATERAGAQMTPLLAHRLATEESPEMQRIRDDVITLVMPVMNPDGLEIVASWYDRVLGTPYETTGPPWLYHYYVGHDNNRDWFMNNMPESRAVTRVLYNEWYPQIVVNHHQTSPAWARIFIPPFTDPVNPHIHPGVTTGVNLVGSAMANRFALENMPGVVSGVSFSMWWNGGMRTVPYYHNMIGILTEVAHATPTPRYYAPDSIPSTIRGGYATDGTRIFYANPWKGGASHFRDAVDYMVTASMGVLNVAAQMREDWLFNIYRMGRDAVEKGRTTSPRAYVIPADQWDPGEAAHLVDILRVGGVEVRRAEAAFTAGDTTYAAGSYVIPTDQAFRPYVVDLMEKQVYPDETQYPGGPPKVPYDLAGWTLPLQMGVRVDRVDTLDAASLTLLTGPTPAPAGGVEGDARFGYVLSHRPNAAVEAVNRLLASGEDVAWAGDAFEAAGAQWDAGTFVVRRGRGTADAVERLADDLGLTFTGIDAAPSAALHRLRQPRVGLYKSWQANMDEGWTRWLLEEYAFAVDTLHDADVRRGDLAHYDAILLPDQSPDGILKGYTVGTMPEEYVGGMGVEGAAALKRYVEQGGTVVAFDAASDFVIDQFGLPVRNVVAGVSSTSFFIPGSLIRVVVDTSHPLAYGMPEEVAAAFSQSRAFEPIQMDRMGEGGREETAAPPVPAVTTIARYADDDLLMSGWASGEKKHLAGKAAVMRAPVGAGNVVLFGFRPQFRGQPRGTYKLIFNALHGATLERLPGAASEAEE